MNPTDKAFTVGFIYPLGNRLALPEGIKFSTLSEKLA